MTKAACPIQGKRLTVYPVRPGSGYQIPQTKFDYLCNPYSYSRPWVVYKIEAAPNGAAYVRLLLSLVEVGRSIALDRGGSGSCILGSAGSGGGLGLPQVDSLDAQHLTVHGLAVLAGLVVGDGGILNANQVTLGHVAVDADVAASGDEALQVNVVHASLTVLAGEVVLCGDGDSDLLGAVSVVEDSGILGEAALYEAIITSVKCHDVHVPFFF